MHQPFIGKGGIEMYLFRSVGLEQVVGLERLCNSGVVLFLQASLQQEFLFRGLVILIDPNYATIFGGFLVPYDVDLA